MKNTSGFIQRYLLENILSSDVFLMPNYSVFSKGQDFLPHILNESEKTIYIVCTGHLDIGDNVSVSLSVKMNHFKKQVLTMMLDDGDIRISASLTGVNPILMLEMLKVKLKIISISGLENEMSHEIIMKYAKSIYRLDSGSDPAHECIQDKFINIAIKNGSISVPRLMLDSSISAANIIAKSDKSRVHSLLFSPSSIKCIEVSKVSSNIDYIRNVSSMIGIKDKLIMMMWPRVIGCNARDELLSRLNPFLMIKKTEYSPLNLVCGKRN